MRRRHLLPRISVLALAGLLSACSWFEEAKTPLPGERIAVISRTQGLEPSADAGQPAVLPAVRTNPDWRNPGGAVNHVNGNLALKIPFQRAWSSSIGSGDSSSTALLTGPVIADGKVYITDASGRLNSLDAATGRSYWRVRVADPEQDSVPIGGGAAYADGTVYATTGFGEAVAVDPSNGGLIWRSKLAGPVRGAPTVTQGRVVAITVDNQTEVLDAKTGTEVWNHSGITEASALLGGGSAAVDDGVVVVPYSSGELYGLRIENGRPVWSATVGGGAARAAGALAGLADITALPAIDGDLVVAVSHGNQAGRHRHALAASRSGSSRSAAPRCPGWPATPSIWSPTRASRWRWPATPARCAGSASSTAGPTPRTRKARSPGPARCWPATRWSWPARPATAC